MCVMCVSNPTAAQKCHSLASNGRLTQVLPVRLERGGGGERERGKEREGEVGEGGGEREREKEKERGR